MTVKFDQKARIFYAALQKGQGQRVHIPVSETVGTISVTGAAVTGTGTQFLTQGTVGAYIYTGTNERVGRILSIESDTALTLYAAIPANGLDASPTNEATLGADGDTTLRDYSFQLGAAHAIRILNVTPSLEITTEEFQFIGDELDRSSHINETDRFFKLDFETIMPALGEIGYDGIRTAGDTESEIGRAHV